MLEQARVKKYKSTFHNRGLELLGLKKRMWVDPYVRSVNGDRYDTELSKLGVGALIGLGACNMHLQDEAGPGVAEVTANLGCLGTPGGGYATLAIGCNDHGMTERMGSDDAPRGISWYNNKVRRRNFLESVETDLERTARLEKGGEDVQNRKAAVNMIIFLKSLFLEEPADRADGQCKRDLETTECHMAAESLIGGWQPG